MFSLFEVNEERLDQLYFNEFFKSFFRIIGGFKKFFVQSIGGFQYDLDIAIGPLFLLLKAVFDLVH